MVSEWKEQGLDDASPEIRLSTAIQKQVINLVLPKKKRIIPPVIVRVETASHQFRFNTLYLSVYSTCSWIASVVS